MTELLTAKDVEVKAFKKVSFGGYAIPEVEDFLNQVADDLEAYALRMTERENRIRELEDYVKKQESMTDMIKDALIQARKGAKEMEDQARVQTGQILADARLEAEKYIAEATSKVEEINSQAGSKISDAERAAAEILAGANARAKEIEDQASSHVGEAEKTAADILAKAKASAADILQEAEDMRRETERRWADLEQELALRKKEATEQIEQTLASARSEARRIVEESSREVEEYDDRLRFLNLRKQQFLKDTVSLLLDFGKTIDKAQQEFETEMERSERPERSEGNSRIDALAALGSDHHQDGSSPRLIERFRRNLLEGKAEDRPDKPSNDPDDAGS